MRADIPILGPFFRFIHWIFAWIGQLLSPILEWVGHHSTPLLNFIHGDGITVLPQMELLLFALGILIFDFLLEKTEKQWNAGVALIGVAASGLGLFMQGRRFNLQH